MSLNRFGVWMERHNNGWRSNGEWHGVFVFDSDTWNITHEYLVVYTIHRVEEGLFSPYCLWRFKGVFLFRSVSLCFLNYMHISLGWMKYRIGFQCITLAV